MIKKGINHKKLSSNEIILFSLSVLLFCTLCSCSNALLTTTEKTSTPKSGTKIVTFNLSTVDSVFSTVQNSNQNARLIVPSNSPSFSDVNKWELTIKDESGISTILTSSDSTPVFSYSLSVGKTYSFTIKGLKESADIKTLFEGSLEKQITEDTTSITLFASYAIYNGKKGNFSYTINSIPYNGERSPTYVAKLTKYPKQADDVPITLHTTTIFTVPYSLQITSIGYISEGIPTGYYELSVDYNILKEDNTIESTTDLSPVDNIVLILDGVTTTGDSTWKYNENLKKKILFASQSGATEGTNIGKTPYVPCSLDYALSHTEIGFDNTIYVYYSGDNPEIDIGKLNKTTSRTIEIYNDYEVDSPCLRIDVGSDQIDITSELDFSIKDSSEEPTLVNLLPNDSDTKIALTISDNANICLMDVERDSNKVNCLSTLKSININGIPNNLLINTGSTDIQNGTYNIPITLSDSVILDLPSSTQPIFTVPDPSPVSLTDVLSNMYIATPGYVFSTVKDITDGKIVAQPYVMWKNNGSILIGDIKDTVNSPYNYYQDPYVDSCIDSFGRVWAIAGTQLVRYTKQSNDSLTYTPTPITFSDTTPEGTIKSISYDSFTDRIYLACLADNQATITLYYINKASTITNSCTIQQVTNSPIISNIGITEINLTVSNDNCFIATKDSSNSTSLFYHKIIKNDDGSLVTNMPNVYFSNIGNLFSSELGDDTTTILENLQVTDMQVIDNSVYLLITDKYTGLAKNINEDQTLISRGGIVKYDFTESSLTLNTAFGANDGDSHDSILGWTDESAATFTYNDSAYEAYWPKDPLQKNDFTNRQNYSFFGPMSFIAIMPKKLVIGDSGYYYYTSDSSTERTKKTTFVEYDLESTAWNGIDLESLSNLPNLIGSTYQDVTFGFEFDDNDSNYMHDFTAFSEKSVE